ncbi:Pde11 [Symbiodinium sp. KB8]|nr:Pde11 [Symbiodinium sp. KB8]
MENDDISIIESKEQQAVDEYCRQHDVQGLIEGLVTRYLSERPKDMKPKEFFAQQLRLEMLAGDEAHLVETTSKVPGYALRQLFEATKKITAEIVPKETIRVIISESLKLLNCDRISLFVYDKRIEMLVLNASNLEHPIRVRPGQGISGNVFRTKQSVNIADCYSDARFDQSFDAATGYVTRNLLAIPIVDFDGSCLGVIEAINKLGDGGKGFGQVDEILLGNLADQVSVALHNAEFYRAAIVTSERANALLQMLQSLTQGLGAQSLIFSVATHASTLVHADRCTVFLVDDRAGELISHTTDSAQEIRIPKTVGIAGECATENKLIVIDDAYEDARFDPEFDQRSGYRTHSIIAVPVKRPAAKDKACAVIQMINKKEFDDEIGKFDEEDVQVLETYAMFVATQLAQSTLVTRDSSKGPGNYEEFMGRADSDGHRERSGSKQAPLMEEIQEGEEGDD